MVRPLRVVRHRPHQAELMHGRVAMLAVFKARKHAGSTSRRVHLPTFCSAASCSYLQGHRRLLIPRPQIAVGSTTFGIFIKQLCCHVRSYAIGASGL